MAAFDAKLQRVPNAAALTAVWPGFRLVPVQQVHRRLFGEPIETVNGGELPESIVQLIEWIPEHALAVEGIFRLSADATTLEWLKSSLNAGRTLEGSRLDPNEVACLLKLYFRALPQPVVPPALQALLLAVDEQDPAAAIRNLQQRVLPQMSPQARALLAKLMWMLAAVARNEQVNRMGARNLAICWAPNIIYDDQAKDQFGLLKASLATTELMIREYDTVFM
jgi:hypothetical protein